MAGAALYDQIMVELFRRRCPKGCTQFDFEREEIREIATKLEIGLPKNFGDVVYSYRYRRDLPESIVRNLPPDKEWILKGGGRAKYRFVLGTMNRIVPRTDMAAVKLPDATPEIIRRYAQGDEQAALARVRYNRLVDIFLGITAYSLQNHLRTSVKGIGQIEIDELYVGVDREGAQFAVPVQAKVKSDRHAVVQSLQDIAYCREKLPNLVCRAVSAQFVEETETIVMFELIDEDGEIKVRNERHY